MLEIKITNEDRKLAARRANNMPEWRLSMRGHEANVVGILGEVIAENWLTKNNIVIYDERNLTTHDYKLGDRKNTFEIKTKDRTVPMQMSYECTVPDYNHSHQDPDFYLFISLERDASNPQNDITRFHTAYIVGAISRKKFNEKKRSWKIGDEDRSNRWKPSMDCWNVYAKDLGPPKTVIKHWSKFNP
ncbi:hypothetical protein [Kordiimonas sp. SCSIO 12610]|uniref:hypothetical protein n=1 Tax=Kordiimonas sp. SCSIO 12610 TaxID=2829597 RepID=UPI00210C140C|nr:hypothetical protein [Kordiimonas sp. SCSIO 12610]UTW54618.1 hypothetical protein KFF44_12510 [Kordiimonas sp. SCSIO 12610]